MSQLVDKTIVALRIEHDVMVALLPNLSEEQLSGQSGASEWTIAQVVSHLGSAAEIGRTAIARAAGEQVSAEENSAIWARWDAASPIDQAAGYVEHTGRWLDLVEGLSSSQRSSLVVDLGFLPEPVPLVVPLGMRLNEVANHGWDVRVGLDPSAEVLADSALPLVEHFAGPLGFLLGFAGKADQLSSPARVAVPGGGIVIDGAVSVVGDLDDATATFRGAPGAVIRLLSGRLRPEHADDVSVEGNVSLDELRRVFPGY